jgi:SAM-dependent methyltransferase
MSNFDQYKEVLTILNQKINSCEKNECVISVSDLKSIRNYLFSVFPTKIIEESEYQRINIADKPIDIAKMNQDQFERAQNTVDLLNIHMPAKHILEIGCGIGHLSRYLTDIGHTVVSTDCVQYNDHNKFYQDALSQFNHPRLPFCMNFPFADNKEKNDRNFGYLKSYSDKPFDIIIWQNSDLLDVEDVTEECIAEMINSLTKFLATNGVLWIGFDMPLGHLTPIEHFPFYNVFKQFVPWDLYNKEGDGVLNMGKLLIQVKKNVLPKHTF